MSLEKNSHFILIGGLTNDQVGRALGPYRIRTILERQGLTCSLIDYLTQLSIAELSELIDYCISANTLVIGFSFTWEQDILYKDRFVDQAATLLSGFKQRYPRLQVMIGAANPNRVPERLLLLSDWVVGGFAELSLPEIMRHIQGQPNNLIYHTVRRGEHIIHYVDSDNDHAIKDCNLLETVFKPQDRYLPYQPITIELCRGCVFNCSYCTYAFKNKKVYDYIRNPESIAQELRRNYDLFGTTRYMLADDTFNDSMEKIDCVRRAVDLAKLPKFEYVCYVRPELLISRPHMSQALVDLGLRGAHFGIESLNSQTRRLVGRSGSIEKLHHAVADLRQRSPVYLGTLGTLILGLPGDTIEDFYRWDEFFCSNVDDFLSSWLYAPLLLMRRSIGDPVTFADQPRTASMGMQSPIERDPAKYGYDVTEDFNDTVVNWKTAHMTYQQTRTIAEELAKSSRRHQKIGGWHVAAAWYNNISDDRISSLLLSQLQQNITPLQRSRYWLQLARSA